jgi:hypothetical protein
MSEVLSIGFTGTQQGLTNPQRSSLFTLLAQLFDLGARFHHGKCIGADSQAHYLANMLGYAIVLHPPLLGKKEAKCPIEIEEGDEIRPRRDYLDRNRDIVNETTILVACPKEEEGEALRSGTWFTVRYARDLKRKIYIIRPNGEVEDGSTDPEVRT